MSFNQRSASAMGTHEKTYFEQQREVLMGEIAMSFEHVLANINKLNRSLEAVVAVGNEFSSVEALWSQFENVMGQAGGDDDDDKDKDGAKQGDHYGDQQQGEQPQDDGHVKREGA